VREPPEGDKEMAVIATGTGWPAKLLVYSRVEVLALWPHMGR
jgi:hypothetical protein